MKDKKTSALENLTQKLSSRDGVRKRSDSRDYLHPTDSSAPRGWMKHGGEKKKKPPVSKTPLSLKFFWFSIAFFIVALVVALLVFLGGSNVVSSENVSLDISLPTTVEAGSDVTLQIVITNNNDVALESTDLIVTYPQGTRNANNSREPLDRTRTSLGEIKPGETVTRSINAVFFGKEEDEKSIHMELEYRVARSNAIFVAEQTHEFVIDSSPINITIDSLEETSSGQEFVLNLSVRSNAQEVIKDLLLSIEYPFGYTFQSASPAPSFDDSVWRLGDLAPGTERTITLRGILTGQDGEEKVFRIESGAQSDENAREIGVVYNSWLSSVSIGRPFLGTEFSLNGEVLDVYSVRSGEDLNGQIEWVNNTPAKITNAEIEVRLEGEVLDKSSVKVRQGRYRSSEDTIVWTKDTKPELSEIEPGSKGTVEFSFQSRSLFPDGNTTFKSPTIHVDISARGERLSESGSPREIKSTVERDVRVISDIGLAGRAVHFVGPLNNYGPLPPQVETATTYTIVWSFVNSSNTISEAEVTTTLPESVSWTNTTSPASEEITYDNRENTVTWDLGVVRQGAGITSDPREVAFQVSLTPSVTDVGQEMDLTKEIVFGGYDEFADVRIRSEKRPLTTDIVNDPQYIREQGKVVE